MLTSIINLISGKIQIEVSPDRFVFTRNDEVKSLKTTVFLSDDSKKRRVLGIGDDFVATQPNVCIRLFQENDAGILPALGKSECLDAYFRYAFRLITRRSAFVRPLVVFRNSESLNTLLCGYQDKVLLNSAMNAGARECIFES